jgi:hypothetical protein
VVIVHSADSPGNEVAVGYSFYRCESADPVSGAVTRVAERREADPLGRLRHVTIEYEVGAAASGVADGI